MANTTTKKSAEQAEQNLLKDMKMTMANIIYSSLDNAKNNWRSVEEIAQQPADKLKWLMDQLAKQIKTSSLDVYRTVVHHYYDYWLQSKPRPYYDAVWCLSNNDVTSLSHDNSYAAQAKQLEQCFSANFDNSNQSLMNWRSPTLEAQVSC